MNDLVWIASGFFLVLFFGFLFYSVWANKKRTDGLQQIALEIGFTFQPKDDSLNGDLNQMGYFELFHRGRIHRASNILRGRRRDAEVILFDYRYSTGGGRSNQTHSQTTILFNLEGQNLADFHLRPKGLLDKLPMPLRKENLTFESYPDFSDQFFLTSSNEPVARHLFDDRVLSWYMQQGNLSAEASESQLLVYRSNKLVQPEDLREFLETGTWLLEFLRRPVAV